MQHMDTLYRIYPKNDWPQTCKPGCGERAQSLSPLGSCLSLGPVIPAFWKAKLLCTTRIHWLLGPAYDRTNFESNIISKCFASSIPNDLRRGFHILQNLLRRFCPPRAEPFECRGMNWNSICIFIPHIAFAYSSNGLKWTLRNGILCQFSWNPIDEQNLLWCARRQLIDVFLLFIPQVASSWCFFATQLFNLTCLA